jgi:hypothetical protein
VNKRHFHQHRSIHRGARRDWHGARKRRKEAPFAVQVATFAAAVGLVTFLAIPRAQSAWTIATRSPEETLKVERSVYYRNCDAARAAGVAPIYRGEQGYREGMDGDNDGIACEPYP